MKRGKLCFKTGFVNLKCLALVYLFTPHYPYGDFATFKLQRNVDVFSEYGEVVVKEKQVLQQGWRTFF
jgi:hypothetical protein